MGIPSGQEAAGPDLFEERAEGDGGGFEGPAVTGTLSTVWKVGGDAGFTSILGLEVVCADGHGGLLQGELGEVCHGGQVLGKVRCYPVQEGEGGSRSAPLSGEVVFETE